MQGFLVRFDAAFTLNQDLLLERHYLERARLSPHRRWSGWQIPGMNATYSTEGTAHTLRADIDRITGKWTPNSPPFTVENDKQPYFKLHGSSNWTDAIGTQLLVMGGNKFSIIGEFPVLEWYHKQFKEYLSLPDTRLLTIGYSFGDMHINQVIRDAAYVGNLRVFIIDPRGVDVIADNPRANPPGQTLRGFHC